MSINVTTLSPQFGARITGANIADGIDDRTFAEIRSAFDEFAILIFPNQPLSDEQQIAFSTRFGPLESSTGPNPGRGSHFARQSNIDIKTGDQIPPDDRRMFYQKANMLWHADSTFKKTPSLCSMLSAREVPAEGGATEFASTRAAYESLPASTKAEIEDVIVEHSFVHSRRIVGFEFTPEEAAYFPGARHRLVTVSPNNMRKGLMIGVHAVRILGWTEDKSRALLDDLLARATRPENSFRHEWGEGDVVIWDNHNALHRATPYDAAKYRRLMQRTTISTGVESPY